MLTINRIVLPIWEALGTFLYRPPPTRSGYRNPIALQKLPVQISGKCTTSVS
jgi:hypothetical protein